jgi:hypothetical protein
MRERTEPQFPVGSPVVILDGYRAGTTGTVLDCHERPTGWFYAVLTSSRPITLSFRENQLELIQ